MIPLTNYDRLLIATMLLTGSLIAVRALRVLAPDWLP